MSDMPTASVSSRLWARAAAATVVAHADLVGQGVGGDGQQEEGNEGGGLAPSPPARSANASVGSAVERPTPGSAPMAPATTPAMTSPASQTAHQSSNVTREFLEGAGVPGMARL